MKKLLLCGAAAALGWSSAACAQDRVENPVEDGPQAGESVIQEPIIFWHELSPNVLLVTASRGNITRFDSTTAAASILTDDQLETRQTRDIADILRDVPSVAVSAIPGQTQLRLRGSEGNHVLVLVDGIEVSDPFAGEFDIGTLQAEIGSSVEILRGPQSALYGSDAIGGVVAYRSGAGEGLAARVEAGNHGTINASARAGIEGLALSATVVSTDGTPNAFALNENTGTRDIGRDSYTLSGIGSAYLTDDFELRAAVRFIKTEGDFNDQDFDSTSPTLGFVIDTPGTHYENEAIYALLGARLEVLDGRWTHDLSGQIADIRRDTFAAFGRSSGQTGKRIKGSYVSSLDIASNHSLTFAADIEREEFRNRDPFGSAFAGERSARNIGLVGEYRYEGGAFDFNAAIRHDFSNRFDDATTFKLGAGYDVTDSTRIRASAGSGIKNPGFFELFGFFDGQYIGNPDLNPEKSFEWEVGLDQEIGDLTLSATYFDAELKDEIFTSFPAPTFIATPDNRDTKSKRRGLELAASANIGEVSLNAAYTHLDAEEDGVTEVRRPDNIASVAMDWAAQDSSASAGIVLRYNGKAQDLAFTDPSFIPARVTLDDYALVNIYGEVGLTGQIRAFGRIKNLLGEEYQQVFSFVSQGRSAIIGISAKF